MRYPDLNEPVDTPIGRFTMVHLNTGEFVECCFCFAVVRKNRAKGHAGVHAQTTARFQILKRALNTLLGHRAVEWVESKWEKAGS